MSGTNLASVYLLYIGLLHLMTIQGDGEGNGSLL